MIKKDISKRDSRTSPSELDTIRISEVSTLTFHTMIKHIDKSVTILITPHNHSHDISIQYHTIL